MYSKTCLKRPLSKRPKFGFKTNYRLMQVNSIEGEHSVILSSCISYYLTLRSVFCIAFNGDRGSLTTSTNDKY